MAGVHQSMAGNSKKVSFDSWGGIQMKLTLFSRCCAIFVTCHVFHGLSFRYSSISIKLPLHVTISGIQWACLSRVCELWGSWEDWGYSGAGKEAEEVVVNGGHHCWLDFQGGQGGELSTKFEASFYPRFQRIPKVMEVALFGTVSENENNFEQIIASVNHRLWVSIGYSSHIL